MKLCEFYKTDYNVSYLNCLRQFWRQTNCWSCIGEPKKNSLILFLDGCSACYTLVSGEKIFAKAGDVVFSPLGSEYSVEFSDFQNETSGTVGINFQICSSAVKDLEALQVFSSPTAADCILTLEKLAESDERVPARYNVEIYRALTALGECTDVTQKRHAKNLIRPGVEYLHAHLTEDISLSTLAAICNVSEVYFRRLFKECYGMSTVRYRLERRLARACEYLEYTDTSVSEISEMLGFGEPSYFIKCFREMYSISPLVYRSEFSNKLEK